MSVRDAIERLGRTVHDISAESARHDSFESDRRERVITVDLDDCRPFDIVRAVYGLRAAGAVDVAARVSSGGEGAHVRGFIEADERTADRLRRSLGDHARRAYMDRTHVLKPDNILFSAKPDGEAGPWRSDPFLAADDLRRRSERYGPSGWSV
jgi:hypothetical protein